MTLIRVKTGEYYDRPEFYPYMPESIFSALEAAELLGNDTAEIEQDDFEKMIKDHNKAKNGTEKS